ncbi:unnamed protein product [Brachionus calyciflorus]|uniref:Uncharacterized protein n=1 Tax=Brachionus calyciflorus TaxID=104777 RepID=A0A814AD65_9BILA|nr:unnamed protein product [Brachionus calyciflorus]
MIDFTKLTKVRSELAQAITSKDPKELRNVLNDGYVNVNYVDKEGQTPLHRSCLTGCLELCKILVEFGASQNIRNGFGWYPIHIASYYGFMDIVKFLLDENNFKKESIIDVFENDEEKYRSNLKNSHPKVSYRYRVESNEEESEESEDDEESDTDYNAYNNNLNLNFDDTNSNADDLINNLNDNELSQMLQFQNLDLNSEDFLF